MLNKEQISNLVSLFNSNSFKTTYLLTTGNKIETAEQLVDSIINKEITIEDMFYEKMDEVSRYVDSELMEIWDDNMELFDLENFHPNEKLLPEGGAWIKVRHETGYQLHFAKTSTRKRRFLEEAKVKYKKVNKALEEAKANLIDSNLDKVNLLRKEARVLELYEAIDLPLYEIRYQRTKTQVSYLNAHQYEICSDEDLQMILDAVRKKTFGVKMRNLYTSVNKDQIFYLRTRGISEQEAMIMANLKQCFFNVEIIDMCDKLNTEFIQRIKVKST